MIIRFSTENFRSIRDKQELTLVASSLKDLPDSLIRLERLNYDLLPVAAIYGANASGKTNVIRGLQFISFAVENSHRYWGASKRIWREPFALDGSSSRPSSFEVEFMLEGIRYRYGFSLDSETINEEWLYAYPNGKQQQWFTRSEAPERKFSFGRNLRGEGEKNRTIESLTRPNSLFLSAAAQNNHETLLPIYNFFVNDIRFSPPRGPGQVTTEELCFEDKYKSTILQYLKAADLGIAGLRAEQEDVDGDTKSFWSAVNEHLAEKAKFDFPTKRTKLLFGHRGQDRSLVELNARDESGGTIAFFSLLGPIAKTLESGGVICVDELDSSLHPLLALELVRMFSDSRNPRGAQMIFNTHDTNLLDSSLLRRDQIWFTEKDSSGATHLYPLSDFKPRKNENLERGYLQGRYGAVPFLQHDLVSQDKDD